MSRFARGYGQTGIDRGYGQNGSDNQSASSGFTNHLFVSDFKNFSGMFVHPSGDSLCVIGCLTGVLY
jgi:hypothetical protein